MNNEDTSDRPKGVPFRLAENETSLRIVSDGTAHGTSVQTADGRKLRAVTAIAFLPISADSGFVSAVIYISGVALDMGVTPVDPKENES